MRIPGARQSRSRPVFLGAVVSLGDRGRYHCVSMISRIALALLVLSVAIVPPNRIDSHVPAVVAPLPPNRLGLHLLLSEGRTPWLWPHWRDHVSIAADAIGEGGYVLQLLSDGNRDRIRWQMFLSSAGRNRLRPIIRIATRYDHKQGFWRIPRADRNRMSYLRVAAEYRDFLESLRWPPGERVVIVGNEPNRGDEWGGRPNPRAYVRYLRDVSTVLRPLGYTVLNAPLDAYCPNTNGEKIDGVRYVDSESYMDGMYAESPEFPRLIDGWASHPYPQGPFTAPPGDQTFKIDLLNGAENLNHVEPPLGIINRGINGYEFELLKLRAYGATNLPVWATETGWRHLESDEHSRDSQGVAISDQAATERLLLALTGPGNGQSAIGYTPWLSDPRVRAIVFFGFNGDPTYWGHSNWLRLDTTGKVWGAYAPFFALRLLRNASPASMPWARPIIS